jgi:hypothetical protein
LADLLAAQVRRATEDIAKINDRTRLLSFNARIEAARAGGSAALAFGVVASAIRDLSEKTSVVADGMASDTRDAIGELTRISKTLATHVRGTRLSDLALTNIELIDRNLYERSCDVRWWATDSSMVDALAAKTPDAYRFCSERLGVILNSYTVYLDLVVCDLAGTVVANGRPRRYPSTGMSCAGAPWFTAALATSSGEEFGFQGLHESPLVDGQRALVYSCCVRENGDAHGAPRGVLGILFDWDALAQTIVHDTPLPPDEKARTRVCIVDDAGLVLADTRGRALRETIPVADLAAVFRQKKGFTQARYEGVPCCIAHAASPGYETYATGWHALILQAEAGGANRP